MIKQVLAISGKPGLYKLISSGNKNLIVETIDSNHKRMPAFSTDRVVSLADISIYTDDDKEVSLASVFESIKQNHDGAAVDLSPKKASEDEIVEFFEKALPNYDKDRVRVSDMRKVLAWYNILINNGINEFIDPKEEQAEGNAEEAEKDEAEKENV